MDLIIVESPTKAKTISKFLGKEYRVESSFGHIRDLPARELGVDLDNGFEPKYVIPTKAKKVVSALKTAAAKAKNIILASDEDREGEAIAWHLAKALNANAETTQRIVFHEITKDAIIEALAHPRQIDQAMVDSQQARRILDRLVGYKLSPFLWKKVAKGLSAGRVQSVATRLIVEREKEIRAFNSEEYWSIAADLATEKKEVFRAALVKIKNKSVGKLDLKEKVAADIKEDLHTCVYNVLNTEKKKVEKSPLAPFTTSTLQQAANRHLGYSAKQTMTVAQKLYEKGFITYMRTDSLNLSAKFVTAANDWITKNLGKEYATGGKTYKNKSKNAQEAHEAIRPTEAENTPDEEAKTLESSEAKLYRLIWQRAVASQAVSAKLAATTINISAKNNDSDYVLRASGQIISFPGYLSIWPEKTKEQELPVLEDKDKLKLEDVLAEKHETVPPARYSDAGLVKEMEKHGVGRPSTYAPTIATIIARNYVERDDNKRLKPTEISFVVTDLLSNHFPKIVDYKFTAQLEDDLDLISSGQKEWRPVISDFYEDFSENLEKKYQEINKEEIMPIEKSEEKCDKCGATMLIKTGRYGKFLACSAFPDCRNIKKLDAEGGVAEEKVKDPKILELEKEHASETCDKCGSPMKVRTGKYGPFLACSAYPKCKNIKNIHKPGTASVACPICQQGEIVKKFSRRGAFYACSNYPQCKNAYQGEPTGNTCSKCSALMILDKSDEEKCSNKSCRKK